MRIEINFTDDELLKIIQAGGEDAEVIFAEGCEIPEAYPPFYKEYENED